MSLVVHSSAGHDTALRSIGGQQLQVILTDKDIGTRGCVRACVCAYVYNNILSHFITLVMWAAIGGIPPKIESWGKPSEHRLLGVTATGDVIMWHTLAMEWMGVCQCVCPAHLQYITTRLSRPLAIVCELVSLSILTINKFAIKRYKSQAKWAVQVVRPPQYIHSCISLSIAPSIMLLDQNIIPCQHIDLLIFIILYRTQPTPALRSRHSNKLNEKRVNGQIKTRECFLYIIKSIHYAIKGPWPRPSLILCFG